MTLTTGNGATRTRKSVDKMMTDGARSLRGRRSGTVIVDNALIEQGPGMSGEALSPTAEGTWEGREAVGT